MKRERVVIDTNVLISAALVAELLPTRARDHAMRTGQLVGTEETVREFVTTLLTRKFDAYATRTAREVLVRRLLPIVEIVPVIQTIQGCRDPRDDKFLEAAVNGRADVIITGDKDLLTMHPFLDIAIVTPAQYLERVEQDG